MKPLSWRLLTLIALVVLVPVLILGDAEAARRSGLAGNLLITDADDMFIFPQHNVTYVNRLIVDMDSDASSGNASLVFGNEESWGLNFSTHRSDFLNGVVAGYWGGNDRGLFGSQFSPDLSGPSTQSPEDLQWFDVGFGWAMDENKAGVRLGIGLDADKTEVSSGPEAKDAANVFSIQGGLTLNETTDITAELAFGSSDSTDTTPDPDRSLEGSVTQFAAGVRGFYEMGGFEWGFLGSLAFSSGDEDVVVGTATEKDEQSITQFMVGWGPVWNDQSEDWQAAGYVTLENQSQSTEPTGPDNNVDEAFFTFPGFRFAAEHRLKSWLWVRGGARSDYFFHSVESEFAGGTVEVTDRVYNFLWTAGVSADWAGFRFDGAINEPWVHAGPSFIGQNEDLFAFASATYNWGGTGAD